GTPLGDPIEASSIRCVFETREGRAPVYVGSSKAHFGHAHYAAGLFGLISAFLSLQNGRVPIQPNREIGLNRRIDWDSASIMLGKGDKLLDGDLAFVSSY